MGMPEFQQTRPRSDKNTCLFVGVIGCLTVVLIAVIVGVVLYFAARNLGQKILDDYTDTQPLEIPVNTMAPDTIQEVQTRLDAFKAGLQEGTATESLTLTADDLNGLIQSQPDFAELRGKLNLSIENGQLRGMASFPLPEGIPGGAGRFVNGEASFDVFVRNGMLNIYLKGLIVKGKPLPDTFLQGMTTENLAKDMDYTTPLGQLVQSLSAIEIGDGVITLVPAGESDSPAGEDPGFLPAEPAADMPAEEAPEYTAEALQPAA